jgi:vitamin B12 transporter
MDHLPTFEFAALKPIRCSSSTFDFASLTSFDIESIELVRGPQSALWGSDAAAGVINIRTRRGETGKSGTVFIEGGSHSTVSGGGSAAFNSDRSGVSVNGSYFDTDGEDATIEGDEDDGYDNLTLSFNAHWLPTQTSRLEFFGRYTEGNTEYDGTDFSTGLPADADNESNDELTLLAVSSGVTLFEDVWDQSIRLTYLDSDHRQSADGVESASTAGEKVGIYYQSTFNLPVWSNFDDQHLILALDYEDEDFKQRGTAFGSFDPNQDQSVDNIGYVAEFLTRPLPGFNLSASVRYDDNSDFDDVTTYRLTASYLFDRTNTRLHSSYGKSQKSPTFIERFGFFPDVYLGNADLKPETNRGFDIGIKQALLAGRVIADVTYFRERLDDEIDGFVFDIDSGLFTADNLNGKSRRNGIEVEAQATLTPSLNASATYTYTDSREPNDSGGRSRELRRPRHMASLNVNQLFLAGRANVNVNVSYSSDQRDRFFPPFPTPPELVKLDSYVLLTVAGSFRAVYAGLKMRL